MDQKIIESAAEAAHEANRIYCAAIGDTSHVPWKDAPEWQRRPTIEGVTAILSGATTEQSHERWCESKRRDGWTFGPVKDAVAKTHPCIVPYDDLPPEQRAKDGLYLAVVRGMAAALGVRVLDLGGGVRAVATPVDTEAGPAFKLTAAGPLLR